MEGLWQLFIHHLHLFKIFSILASSKLLHMKKILKWVLIIVGIIVLLLGVTALIIALKPLPKFTAENPNYNFDYLLSGYKMEFAWPQCYVEAAISASQHRNLPVVK